MGTRNGTDIDAAAAMKTFSQLGYKVVVANDQTVDEMNQKMLSGKRNYSLLCTLSLKCYTLKYQHSRQDTMLPNN